MKRIFIFTMLCAIVCSASSMAAVRSGTVRATGQSAITQRVTATTPVARTATTRIPASRTTDSARVNTTAARTATARTQPQRATTPQTVVSRAADDAIASISETRTGAAYERCKSAYFTCMDQFCALKNDDYRRCSCSNRVYDLISARKTLQSAAEQLTEFTENLDVVGMSVAQVNATKTASEGENALAKDKSASKALLQAIMNSIRGQDATVGGKYSALNNLDLSFDTVNMFGIEDTGQIIATYNGQELYSAVYPQCRSAVIDDCNKASLQRAVTAYLMAIEQDCNTVQTAIDNKIQETKAAIREGGAMLDLARVENRQKHNSSDLATCVNEIESAITSDMVCGSGYHKCLDNGEFIDIDTGKAIIGVIDFYELGKLLTFSSDNTVAANQKLSTVTTNQPFVKRFEDRVKKFAAPALDKCTDVADVAWAEYLDRALLTIYYAQQDKVKEIKQGCFDFISNCYANIDTGLTDAMRSLLSDVTLVLQPDRITLNKEMCANYVASCNNMFDGDIIDEYVETRADIDTTAACRAIASECFGTFGGAGYENFYYPYSTLFTRKRALDWFTLYGPTGELVSECAKQLDKITSCRDKTAAIFGGFDSKYTTGNIDPTNTYAVADTGTLRYGTIAANGRLKHHVPRPTGVATEVYNQIIDTLTTQCANIQGRFIEYQYLNFGDANYANASDSNPDGVGYCLYNGNNTQLTALYKIGQNENMCPRDYNQNVDTTSWGSCLCWENGGRRSKRGKSAKCMEILPAAPNGANHANDKLCSDKYTDNPNSQQISLQPPDTTTTDEDWCTVSELSVNGQVCSMSPNNGVLESLINDAKKCTDNTNNELSDLPGAI